MTRDQCEIRKIRLCFFDKTFALPFSNIIVIEPQLTLKISLLDVIEVNDMQLATYIESLHRPKKCVTDSSCSREIYLAQLNCFIEDAEVDSKAIELQRQRIH